MHDGAAVIVGDRIARVGVVLPLTLRDDLPSHYGTRHRAAAGLAESSDALVVVVSEERGEVLTASRDRLAPVHSPRSPGRAAASPKRFRRHGRKEPPSRPRRNGGPRPCCPFSFVTTVWFSFSRGLEALTTLEVPVEYMNRAPEMELVETSTNTVKLDLGGSRSADSRPAARAGQGPDRSGRRLGRPERLRPHHRPRFPAARRPPEEGHADVGGGDHGPARRKASAGSGGLGRQARRHFADHRGPPDAGKGPRGGPVPAPAGTRKPSTRRR